VLNLNKFSKPLVDFLKKSIFKTKMQTSFLQHADIADFFPDYNM